MKKILAGNPAIEDPCQRVDYSYDQGPGGVGRLTRVRWGWTTGQVLPGIVGVVPCAAPGGFDEFYTYNSAGRLLSKTLQHVPGNISRVAELKLNYTYDSNGRVTSVTYPFRVLRAQTGSGRPVANVTYDGMGRMSGLTWTGVPGSAGDPVPSPVTVASGAVYDARNALTSLNVLGAPELRQFNVMGQLTRISQAGVIDIEYRYSTTANDGKITSQKNWISGEEVVYQYDELERLSSAATTGPAWGLSWAYDGFGNRLSQSVTKGSGPTSTTLVNAWTNRISSAGFAYDLNGNTTAMPQLNSTLDYDWSNRVTAVNNSNGSFQYAYAPDNRRIWFKAGVNDPSDLSLNNGERYVLYSPGGQKMGTYKLDTSGSPTDPLGFFPIEENLYWGGRLVARYNGGLQRTTQDRLSSELYTYPYGESRFTGLTTGGTGREAFATYTRDSQTGLDYADQRYYAGVLGRFANPDPYKASSEGAHPSSWNRFSYVDNDPVNFIDPAGLARCSITTSDLSLTIECTSSLTGLSLSDSLRNPPAIQNINFFGLRVADLERAVERGTPHRFLNRFTDALRLAVDALRNPDKCGKLFGKSDGFFSDPGRVLEQLVTDTGTPYGRLSAVRQIQSPLGPAAAFTNPQGNGTASERAGTDGFVYGSANITISQTLWGSPFAGESIDSRDIGNARILIHELGHFYNLVSDAPGSAFVWDSLENGQGINRELEECLPFVLKD